MKAPGGSCEHLGAFGGSFWLSWLAFWSHFAFLGTLFGFILALLGRHGTSWDAFFAQVGPSSPKITKKTLIFQFDLRKLAQVGTQKLRKIDAASDIFLKCIFDIDFHRFLIDFGLENSTFGGSILQVKAKTTIL